MATTVVKSIGSTGRAYSTLQAWEDAAPSNLTTALSNNCTGGTTSTIILDAGASAVNDFYTGHTVVNISAQERLITAYNGTTKIATIGALNGSAATWTAPITGEAFTINDVIWQGQAYNDSEFINNILVISGATTNSSAYLDLTVAAGQSFQDAAGVRTNALKYNQSNGVGLRTTVTYATPFRISVANTRVSRFQLKHDGAGSTDNCIFCNAASVIVKDCITSTANEKGVAFASSGGFLINVLCFLRETSGNGMQVDNGATAIGCTVIRTTDNSPAGVGFFNAGYGTNVLQSCASFGFSTCATGSGFSTTLSKNNATDKASGFPGSTGNQYSITFNSTSPFTNSTVASQNSIPVTGTALSANGFLDATNAPNDISATARAATPTIGVWELVSAVTVLMSMWNHPVGRPVDNPIKVVGY